MCLEMSPTSNLFFGYVPCFGIDIFGGGVTIVFAGLRVVSFAGCPRDRKQFLLHFFSKKNIFCGLPGGNYYVLILGVVMAD